MALVIPAIAAGVQAAYGIYRGIRADRALKELQKQRMPQLMDAAGPLQQNLAMAQRQYTQGLAPQTRALALGTMASQMAAQRRTATDLAGGQLGTALGRIGAFNTNQMGLNLGAQNQQARERGMAQTMSANAQLSGLQQSDIRENIRQRLMMEQAYGQARQQAGQDVIGAIGGFGMAALNNAQFNKLLSASTGAGNNTSAANAALGAVAGATAGATPSTGAGQVVRAVASSDPGFGGSALIGSPAGFSGSWLRPSLTPVNLAPGVSNLGVSQSGVQVPFRPTTPFGVVNNPISSFAGPGYGERISSMPRSTGSNFGMGMDAGFGGPVFAGLDPGAVTGSNWQRGSFVPNLMAFSIPSSVNNNFGTGMDAGFSGSSFGGFDPAFNSGYNWQRPSITPNFMALSTSPVNSGRRSKTSRK